MYDLLKIGKDGRVTVLADAQPLYRVLDLRDYAELTKGNTGCSIRYEPTGRFFDGDVWLLCMTWLQ